MGRSRYKITNPELPHFITLTVLHWIPVFTRQETVNILLESLKFLSKDGLKVYAYVVLENHCHLVVQSKAGAYPLTGGGVVRAKVCGAKFMGVIPVRGII